MGNWEGLKNMGIFLLVVLGMFAFLAVCGAILGVFVHFFGIDAIPVVCGTILFGFMVWGFMGDDIDAWWKRRKGQQ